MKRLSSFRLAAVPLVVLSLLGITLPANAGTFTFTLSKNTANVNTAVLSGAGPWNYNYTVTGRVSSVGLNIKNHAPGAADFCSAYGERQPSGTISYSTDTIPAAGFQVCGVQWVDPDPELWLVAYVQTGDNKAKVVVTVTYPDP